LAKAPKRPPSLRDPLTDAELDELDAFLLSDAVSEEAMLFEAVDGYLTAIVIGPELVPPGRWLAGIWGPTEEDAPKFETMAQAQRIIELLMRHMNGIAGQMMHDPDTFEPICAIAQYPDDSHEYEDGEMWAMGFMEGVALSQEDWQPLLADLAGREFLRPIRLLGLLELSAEEKLLSETPAQRETLTKSIPASVAAIHRFWLPYREGAHQRTVAAAPTRSPPSPGRNEPCSCGSGKKFKKCCGVPERLH
jgi:uncharacterized protein